MVDISTVPPSQGPRVLIFLFGGLRVPKARAARVFRLRDTPSPFTMELSLMENGATPLPRLPLSIEVDSTRGRCSMLDARLHIRLARLHTRDLWTL